MSSEKFSPNSSSSENAENLPETVTDRLKSWETDHRTGLAETVTDRLKSWEGDHRTGFAEFVEQPEQVSGKLALKSNSHWQKILFAIGGEPEFSHPLGWLRNDDSLLGKFLTEQWKKEANKKLDQQADIEILQTREMCRDYILNWLDRQMELARCEFFEKQGESLKELGHTGWLTKNQIDFINKIHKTYGDQDKTTVEGVIDGKGVRFSATHSTWYDEGPTGTLDYEGAVGPILLSESGARELYQAYSPLAFDLDYFYFERRNAIKKALSCPDDQTIDDNTRKMYQQFRESLKKKTSTERAIDTKKEEQLKATEARSLAEKGKVILAQKTKEEQKRVMQEAEKKRSDYVWSVYPKQKQK